MDQHPSGLPNFGMNQGKEITMNKLLSALIAGLMVSGAMAQTGLSTTLQGNTGVSATPGVGVTGGVTGGVGGGVGTTAGAGVSGSGNLSGSTSGSLPGASRANTNLMGAAGAGATGIGTTGSAGATGSTQLNGQLCPPGLAKRGNGCMPPGQAKKQ
jgi:hypothetical protein